MQAMWNTYQFRDVYLLATAAEDAPHTVEGSVKAVQCLVSFDVALVVHATGEDHAFERCFLETVHPALKESYEMGMGI